MFLGIDIHIDHLAATVIDTLTNNIVYKDTILFDDVFPAYGTKLGLLPSSEEGEYSSSPILWIEAIELLFERLSYSHVNHYKIRSIGGSALSSFVLTKEDLNDHLMKLNPTLEISDALRNILAYDRAPTIFNTVARPTRERLSKEISQTLVSQKTGVRFNSTHGICWLKHLHEQQPEIWQSIQQIHTATSFIRSVLIGRVSRVNISDIAHFALYNHQTLSWDEELCALMPENTHDLLPEINSSYDNTPLSSYFINKYGFSEDIQCSSWISRETAYFTANACKDEDIALMTLNDSFTFYQKTPIYPREHHISHQVLPHPFGGFLLCYEMVNGLRATKAVASALQLSDEAMYAKLNTPQTRSHAPVLPFIYAETRQNIEAVSQSDPDLLTLTLGQMAHLKLFTQSMPQATKIRVAGKGTSYRGLLQTLSNTFVLPVGGLKAPPSHSLAAAMCAATSEQYAWSELFDTFLLSDLSADIEPEPYLSSTVYEQIREYHQLLLQHTS